MARLDYSQASDAELVACFAAGRDQRAFEQLVVRHGPMVLGVARRIVTNREDAEDAFQATFLALAKAAGRLKRTGAVAAWLHQTAVRSARAIRRMNAKWNRKVERQKEVTRESDVNGHRDDMRQVLDEELARLPEKLRAAIVLCDLEGLTRREAAARLGVPSPTVSDQVAKARRVLRSRLARRGIGLSVAALAPILPRGAQASTLSSVLVRETTTRAVLFASGKSAAEIGVSAIVFQTTKGVIAAMTMTKVIQLCALAVAVLIGVGATDSVLRILANTASAETLFFDTFDDGDFSSDPGWVSLGGPYAGTTRTISGDSLVITKSGLAGVGASGVTLDDVSIRSQMRLQSGEALGLTVRVNLGQPFDNYFGFVAASGNVLLGVGTPASGEIILDSAATDLKVLQEDVLLQLDAIGNELRFWAWRPGEARPADPLLRATDNRITSGGMLGLFAATRSTGQSAAEIRFVQIDNTTIPEPATAGLAALGLGGLVTIGCWLRRR